jgi:hypothetical protein
VSCDAACRDRCEQLVVARKARRIWNVSVRCPIDETVCGAAQPLFYPAVVGAESPTVDWTKVIQPTGPVIAFRLGVDYTNRTNKQVVRDTQVRFTTRSGFRPTARYSSVVSGGTGIAPSGGAAFDRSANTAWNKESDGMRVFVPYLDGTLVDSSPSHTNSGTVQRR